MDIQKLEFLKHVIRFNRRVYLDHNATTPVSSAVRRQIHRVLTYHFGNPSSFYALGRKAAELLEHARRSVAGAIHAAPQEIFFTSCATEANNAVLKSAGDYFYPRRKKIVSTPIEHPSVIRTLAYLEEQGMVVDFCPVDSHGRVRLEELAKRVDGETCLVCCMLANNETGAIQDLPAVVNIAKQHGALVLSDAVQALGKIPLDARHWGVDYATFSAHKLYGPKGVGALYIRQGSPFIPLLHGGGQEGGMRAGTENLHNIVGFGVACREIDRLLAKSAATQALKRQLVRHLKEIKPDCVIHSPEAGCLPNTLSVAFPGVDNAGLMAFLDYHGIAVSAGSACSTGEGSPSHVLKAMGLSDQTARETIRISLGRHTSAGDLRYTVRVIRDYIAGQSPLVQMITPLQLNEALLFDESTYILDVRPPEDRKKFHGLPNSHEVAPLAVEKYLAQLPRDKNILVVCPGGGLSLMVSYYLKAKGFKHVINLRGGLDGWRNRRADLYQKYAGQNITVLQQDAEAPA